MPCSSSSSQAPSSVHFSSNTSFIFFADNYEIEWDSASENGKDIDFAQEIATAMRRTHRESERQMNKAFKVASDAHC